MWATEPRAASLCCAAGLRCVVLSVLRSPQLSSAPSPQPCCCSLLCFRVRVNLLTTPHHHHARRPPHPAPRCHRPTHRRPASGIQSQLVPGPAVLYICMHASSSVLLANACGSCRVTGCWIPSASFSHRCFTLPQISTGTSFFCLHRSCRTNS
jgi:hypothetical protein